MSAKFVMKIFLIKRRGTQAKPTQFGELIKSYMIQDCYIQGSNSSLKRNSLEKPACGGSI